MSFIKEPADKKRNPGNSSQNGFQGWQPILKGIAPWTFFGVLLGLSAPGYGLGMLAWVALIPVLMRVAELSSPREAFIKGFSFGATYHYVYLIWYLGLHPAMWIGLSPFESIMVALGAWSLASLWGALFTGFIFIAYHLLYPRLSRPLRLAVFPLIWIAGFQLFRHTDFGVPWAFLEYTQSGSPWIRGLADLLGNRLGLVLGGGVWISGLIVLYNLAWAEWFQSQPDSWNRGPWLAKAKTAVVAAILPLALLFPMPWAAPPPELPLPVAVIQGNLPIDVVRSSELSRQAAVSAYLKPLREGSFPSGTLVILPEEGAVPVEVALSAPLSNLYLWNMHVIAKEKNISVMTGAITYEPHTGALYNSLALITPDARNPVLFYHKRHLVPFGEYTPYLDASFAEETMSAFGVSYSTPFRRGEAHSLPIVVQSSQPNAVRLGSLVCFELIYPELSDQYWSQRADLLVNSSNLGWFHGNHWLEQQFLAIGQMRAAETHLPLVISANTGVSAIIAADGTILTESRSSTPATLTQFE